MSGTRYAFRYIVRVCTAGSSERCSQPDGYPVFDAGGQAVWVDAAHPELITNVALRAIFKIRCRRLSGDIDNDGDSVFQLRTELVHLAYV